MRALITASCGFWCAMLLACAVSGIASARMIGGRNTLAVPENESRGELYSSGFVSERSVQIPQEKIEEALVAGVKSGSIQDALKKYVDSTQSIFDRFCMAQIDRSEAGRDIAALAMSALEDAGVREEVESDKSVAEFFSIIGSPAADLGLFNNLLWVFSSSAFPIENFCLETAAGMPAAHDVAGVVNQAIDSLLAENNIELVGKVLKAGAMRLSGLFAKVCSGDKSGKELVAGLYSLLEDFMAIHPDVERTVLDAFPFMLPSKPAVTKSDIKDTLNFVFTSGLFPLVQICDAFGTTEESKEMMAPIEEESKEMMAPVQEEEVVSGCAAVDNACPFSSFDITHSKDLVHIMPQICMSPSCMEAINNSGCFREDVTSYVVDACTCYSALSPECRESAWVDTPRAAQGVYVITQEIGSGKGSLTVNDDFLKAIESSSKNFCPAEDGAVPSCLAEANKIPQCARFGPEGTDGPDWEELCCAAPLLEDKTCRDFVNFLGNGETWGEAIEEKMEGMMNNVFDQEKTPAVRAEMMKTEYGVETFGGALQAALSSGCRILGALDKEAARTCMPKMQCMTKKALGPAGQHLDMSGQVDMLLDMTEAICGGGCISTVLGECFDAPLEPYLSFLDTAMNNPEALMSGMGMDGGKMDWGFIHGMMPLLEPLCADKCQASIDTCDTPLMEELGLNEMSGALTGMCGLMKFLGPAALP